MPAVVTSRFQINSSSVCTDPVYLLCTLYSGNVNETDCEVTTTNTTEALVNTTTTADILTTTSRPTPETTTVTMIALNSQPTEPSVSTSVYFELNGKVYPNNISSLCLRSVKMSMP